MVTVQYRTFHFIGINVPAFVKQIAHRRVYKKKPTFNPTLKHKNQRDIRQPVHNMRTGLFKVITQRPRRAQFSATSRRKPEIAYFLYIHCSAVLLFIYFSCLSPHVRNLLFPHVPYSVFTISVVKRLVQTMKHLFLYFYISCPVAWLYP